MPSQRGADLHLNPFPPTPPVADIGRMLPRQPRRRRPDRETGPRQFRGDPPTPRSVQPSDHHKRGFGVPVAVYRDRHIGPLQGRQGPGLVEEMAGQMKPPVAAFQTSAKTVEGKPVPGDGRRQTVGFRLDPAAVGRHHQRRRRPKPHLDREIPALCGPFAQTGVGGAAQWTSRQGPFPSRSASWQRLWKWALSRSRTAARSAGRLWWIHRLTRGFNQSRSAFSLAKISRHFFK